MRCLVARTARVLLIATLATGCATHSQNLTAREAVEAFPASTPLGTVGVRVVAGSRGVDVVMPSRGRVAGASAANAVGTTFGGLGAFGPGGVFVGLMVAPLSALGGAIAGAVRGEPAERIAEMQRIVDTALADLDVADALTAAVISSNRPDRAAAVRAVESPSDATLEILVERLGLGHTELQARTVQGPPPRPFRDEGVATPTFTAASDPLLTVILNVTVVLRAADRTFTRRITYQGETHPLSEWTADGGASLREGFTQGCTALGARIVDELL